MTEMDRRSFFKSLAAGLAAMGVHGMPGKSAERVFYDSTCRMLRHAQKLGRLIASNRKLSYPIDTMHEAATLYKGRRLHIEHPRLPPC